MSLVLDSSATLAFIIPNESTPAIEQLLDQITGGGAWVPSLWRLEIANSLTAAVRRGRISAEFRNGSLHDLTQLDIRIDHETDAAAWNATLRLADAHRLTLYDAAYLELAKRRALPIATLDKALLNAVIAEGVVALAL